MRITCKLGARNIKVVEVSPDDPLHILLKKLNICDKNTKFIFNGVTYSMGSIQTFREIGIMQDCRIAVNNQTIAGGSEFMKEINIKFIICQKQFIFKQNKWKKN